MFNYLRCDSDMQVKRMIYMSIKSINNNGNNNKNAIMNKLSLTCERGREAEREKEYIHFVATIEKITNFFARHSHIKSYSCSSIWDAWYGVIFTKIHNKSLLLFNRHENIWRESIVFGYKKVDSEKKVLTWLGMSVIREESTIFFSLTIKNRDFFDNLKIIKTKPQSATSISETKATIPNVIHFIFDAIYPDGISNLTIFYLFIARCNNFTIGI